MAENLLLDLAITVMVENYNLDEHEYSMFKFNEGSNAISIGMTNGEVPVSAVFPRDYLRFEEMKRWDDSKKEMYVRHQIAEDLPIPNELSESFHHILMMVEMPSNKEAFISEEQALKLAGIEISVERENARSEEPTEETAEEFVEKTEGKKARRKLAKKK